MRLLNSREMQQVEQYTAKYGLSYQRMMENAGSACARNIRNVLETKKLQKKNIVVVCGRGNNGGDGFVVARKFSENGYSVTIILASGYPQTQEAVYMYKMAVDLAIPTIWYDADKFKSLQSIKNAEVIVDAVFGFGFRGDLSEDMASLFNEMSSASGIKFAVDVPSGVYCDSGFNAESCVKVDYTIAISALKPAHVIHPAADCCGSIIVASIGIPEESYSFLNSSMYTYSFNEVKALFKKRKTTGNKGDFGRVLCICGSRNMVGAAVLCVKGALRSGAGLVTAAFPDCAYGPIASQLTESLMLPLNSNMLGTLSVSCKDKLLEAVDKADCVVIGCGLGVNGDTKEIVREVLSNAECPVIVDADGLNIIASDIDILKKAPKTLIFTPHPGEMSRLTQKPVSEIQADRLTAAKTFADAYSLTLVLKGSNTVVAAEGEQAVYVNSTGNSGMAKGGCGDLLAGMLAGFVAQGMNVTEACCGAVYVHGYVGETVSEELSLRGMLPSDMADALAKALGAFES